MSVEDVLPAEVDGYKMGMLLGISPRAVRDWASRGVLVRGSRVGRYKTFESLRAYIDHLLDGRDPDSALPTQRPSDHDDQHLKRLIKEALSELANEGAPVRGGKSKTKGPPK